MALGDDDRYAEFKRISVKMERYKSDLVAAENALHSEIRRFVQACKEIDRLNNANTKR